MALTRLDKTGDGTTTVYDVDFDLGFISRGHVYVYLAENSYTEQLSYTWLNNTQIQLATPVTSGVDFAIRRVVPRDNIVNDYESGAILREKELDNSFKQAIMILQEIEDGYIEVEGTFVVGGNFKAEGEIEDGTGNILSEKMNNRPDADHLNIVVFDENGNSEDSGVSISGLEAGEGFAFTESKTLADGQVDVNFNLLNPITARFVVCGDNVDGSPLCAADYTVIDSSNITLTSSYPAGTVLMGIQNEQTADIERSARYFTRHVTLAKAVANTNVQEGDTVIISDRGNGLFEYKTAKVTDNRGVYSCTGVPHLYLVQKDYGVFNFTSMSEILDNTPMAVNTRLSISDNGSYSDYVLDTSGSVGAGDLDLGDGLWAVFRAVEAPTQETINLVDGQTTVVFSLVPTTNIRVYVDGDSIDRGRLFEGVGFSKTNPTTIELLSSYPSGTVLLAEA